jgi:hypothetical protein
MAAGYNAQGQYVDHQGNPAPDPRTGDMAPAMSQAISNLFGTSYTPGRVWDPSMGPEEEFDPTVPHDPTALATGRSGGGTFMPVQIGTTGAATLPKGIQADIDTQNVTVDEEAGGIGEVLANIPEFAQMSAQGQGDPYTAADNIPVPKPVPSKAAQTPQAPPAAAITAKKEPAAKPAEAATPPAATATTAATAQPTDTSGQAGFEKVLNMGGFGLDWLRDLIWSKGAGGAAIGLQDFFNRPTPENIALLERMEKKRQADIEGSKGEFGTYVYDRGWGNTLDDILGAVTTDEPSSVTVDVPPPTTGYDVTASTKGSRGAEIAATRRAKKAQLGTDPGADEAVETQVPTTLDEVVDIPPPPAAAAQISEAAPENTDRLKAATRTHGGITSAQPVTDEVLDVGGPVNLGNATDMPFQELVAILAPLTAPQRANILKDMGPQMKADILAALDDYDTVDDTGI